jgi:hypothetical protein
MAVQMLTISEIPIQPGQPQTFRITLSGIPFAFRLQWRELLAQCWLLDIADENNNQLIAGVPLLAGANLLSQYTDLNFPGELWVASDGEPDAPPTFGNLGVNSHLYYVVRS